MADVNRLSLDSEAFRFQEEQNFNKSDAEKGNDRIIKIPAK